MTDFLRQQIEKRLSELRSNCAVKRLIKSNAFGRRWARSARSEEEQRRDSGSSDNYWDARQAEAQRSSTSELEIAEKELKDFIAQHRSLMPEDWIGNQHGRLCWAPYLGGIPIDQHYCQQPENHIGPHADEIGQWPSGVTNEYEWALLRNPKPA